MAGLKVKCFVTSDDLDEAFKELSSIGLHHKILHEPPFRCLQVTRVYVDSVLMRRRNVAPLRCPIWYVDLAVTKIPFVTVILVRDCQKRNGIRQESQNRIHHRLRDSRVRTY